MYSIIQQNTCGYASEEYISTIHVLRWPLVPRMNTTQYIRKYMYCDDYLTSKYLLIQRNTRYDTCIATIDLNTLKYITKYTYSRRLIWIHVDTFAIQIGYMYFCRPSRILWNMIEIQQEYVYSCPPERIRWNTCQIENMGALENTGLP